MNPVGIDLGRTFLRSAVFSFEHGPKLVAPAYAARQELLSRVAVRGGVAMVLPVSAAAVESFGLLPLANINHDSRVLVCTCLLRRSLRDARVEQAAASASVMVSLPVDDPDLRTAVEDAFDCLGLPAPRTVDPRIAAVASLERPAPGAWIVVESGSRGPLLGLVHADADTLRLLNGASVGISAWNAARSVVSRRIPNAEAAMPFMLDATCADILSTFTNTPAVLRQYRLHERRIVDVGLLNDELQAAIRDPIRALADSLERTAKDARSLGLPIVGVRASGGSNVSYVLREAMVLARLDPQLLDNSPPPARFAQACGLAVLASGRLRAVALVAPQSFSNADVALLHADAAGVVCSVTVITRGSRLPAAEQVVRFLKPGQRAVDIALSVQRPGAEPKFLTKRYDLTSFREPPREFLVRVRLDENESLNVEAFFGAGSTPIPKARQSIMVGNETVDPAAIPLVD